MFKTLLSGAAAAGILAAGAAFAAPQGGQHAKTATAEARTEVQARVQALFVKLDSNHDGFVTDAEADAATAKRMAKIEERAEQRAKNFEPGKMFARLDSNKDGKITKAEVEAKASARKAAKGKAPAAMNKEITEFFAHADANKDGAITMAELSAAPRPQMPAMRKAAMHKGKASHLLGAADLNKDGKVSLAEAQALAFKQFDGADANHDGKVTPQERKAKMQALRAQHKPS